MRIGQKEFDTANHTYVMGILNVTPDSFSDGGKWNNMDGALFHTEEMIEAGADMINDIWGLKYDSNMAEVIARSGLPCCLMHNRKAADYRNYMNELLMDMEETLEIAERAGIGREKICIDPGVGFGKTYENNLEIINKLEMLHTFGLPVLLGTSRKSVIGLTLDLPVEKRLEGTLATTVMGVMKGAAFVRVHDVKENVRAIRMTEAILHS